MTRHEHDSGQPVGRRMDHHDVVHQIQGPPAGGSSRTDQGRGSRLAGAAS